MIEEELPKLLAHFTVVPDPRAENVSHKLEDILAIAICAVICGADSFTEIEQYAQGKRAWLETFLDLSNGVPSHDTFRRVFMLLEAEAWQGVFFDWTRKLTLVETASPTEVRAVDGKWSRSSGLHTVSVWASGHHVVLAQRQVADKSNEITVIPELLEVLDLAGATVTIDAAGTQKQIAWVIREHHADYVLALKANHKHLFDDVKWLFAQHDDAPHCSTSNKGHGRTETRDTWLLTDLSFLDVAAWRDLAGVARVRSTREIKGEVSVHDRYFLTLKASIKAKRMRAGWDDDYLLKVLYA